MSMYDYLIVGAGLYGSTVARLLSDAGKKVLVIDKRDHIGGNCYTQVIDDIHVHKYGAHILHTNDVDVWSFILRFTEVNNYTNRVRVYHGDRVFSFPINMNTLHQVFGVVTPQQARELINSKKIDIPNPKNLKEWALSQVGEELYNIFIEGYTKKQWGKSPEELPSSIIKRLPIRYTYNDNYFNDQFQGIPSNGYTAMFESMLHEIEVMINTNYLDDKEYWRNQADKVIYCGRIDEYFDYCLGNLEWRSLLFETKSIDMNDFQGAAVVNYAEEKYDYTRILEHKHFQYTSTIPDKNKTVITYEYPAEWNISKEAYYPVRDSQGQSELYDEYCKLAAKDPGLVFKGRLAEYVYRDMCPTIRLAMDYVANELY